MGIRPVGHWLQQSGQSEWGANCQESRNPRVLSLCSIIFAKGIHNNAKTFCKYLQSLWASLFCKTDRTGEYTHFAKLA